MAVYKPMPEQVYLKAPVAMVMSVPHTAGIPLRQLWPKDVSVLEKVRLEVPVAVDKSVLQQVHVEASVAVHEVMPEHLKVRGHG